MLETNFVSLGDLTPGEFLERYWQKEPLLIRQAIPGFCCPLDPDGLAGLACEPEADARLILERGADPPWQLLRGPFDEEEFERLPETHWSLLVRDVNRFVPEIADLMDRFRFVPDWRLDDVMISYAAPQGSVGAHIDSYDVFLLQGLGRRRWEIGSRVEDPALVPGLDVRILSDFRPDRSWVLEPGDMLYLPPGVPHHGVALDPCMTLSIGFLAPSRSELLSSWLCHYLEATGQDSRYSDPGLSPQEAPGEITAQTLDRMEAMLAGAPMDRALLGPWLGCFLTRSRPGPGPEPAEPPHDEADWRQALEEVGCLRRSEGVRMAFLREGDRARLFVDGEARVLEPDLAPAAGLLTGSRTLSAEALAPWLGRPGFPDLLVELTNSGYFYFPGEEED